MSLKNQTKSGRGWSYTPSVLCALTTMRASSRPLGGPHDGCKQTPMPFTCPSASLQQSSRLEVLITSGKRHVCRMESSLIELPPFEHSRGEMVVFRG